MKLGIVGDIHAPFEHSMYKRFCQDIFEQWGVTQVHFIGDILDLHSLSFHEQDPAGLSAGGEYDLAREYVAEWYKLFPKATVSIGNHDCRVFRKARNAGIPDQYIKSYNETWLTPKWDWQLEHQFEGFIARHGTGSSGKYAAINQAIQRRTSLVQGHVHQLGGVQFHSSHHSRIWGMGVGCGIDCDSYAMAYGKDFAVRPMLGCGVVIDGHPYFEAMNCSPGEKYHKSRAGRRR